MSEKAVQSYQTREVPFRRFKGLMAAYPMLTDSQQLLSMDGWLLNTPVLALRKRQSQGYSPLPPPHGLDTSELLSLKAQSSEGDNIDLRVPSFRRVANVIRRGALAHGAASVASPLPYGY